MPSENRLRKFGFTPPVITEDNYVLGGLTTLPKIVLQVDGQWDKFLPEFELQTDPDFDTFNCVAFATTSAVELLVKRLYIVFL
jgi:uroporphyrinogen-III synthase